MKVVRKKLFYLSSRDRQPTESIQRFSIYIPDNIMSTQQNEKLRLTMIYFSLVNSFQSIDANNQQFGVTLNYTYNGVPSVSTKTLYLPLGSYNINQIATNTTTLLNTAFSNIGSSGNGVVFTVAIPTQTTNFGRWSWVTQTTGLNTFTVQSVKVFFNSTMFDTAIQPLGFSGEWTNGNISNVSTTLTNPYTTPKNMFTGQTPYLRVHCDIPPINIEYNTANQLLNFTDVLAQVPILVPPYYPIVYQDFGGGTSNTFELPNSGMKLGLINFYLTNQYNTAMVVTDDWDFTISVEVLVDDQIEALAKESLQLQKISLLKGNTVN